MSTRLHDALRQIIFDARRCGDPATVLLLIGMRTKRRIVKPDDIVQLDETEVNATVAFLDRWFQDRSARLVEGLCAAAAAAPP